VPAGPEKTQQLLDQGKRLYKEVGCNDCHGEQGRGDGPSAGGLKDDWGWSTWPSDLTWRPLKRGSDTKETYLTLVSGLSGTPMPSYADSLSSRELWALVYYLELLVPRDHRLDPNQLLGEEQQGWMALRMGGMMGGGMMGPGMMQRSR
jgi:mono/diheme cytochrome c family protein